MVSSKDFAMLVSPSVASTGTLPLVALPLDDGSLAAATWEGCLGCTQDSSVVVIVSYQVLQQNAFGKHWFFHY